MLDAVGGCSGGCLVVLDVVDGCCGGLLVVLDAGDGRGEVGCCAGVVLDAGEGRLRGISIALTALPSFCSILRLAASTLKKDMQSTSSSSESASK